MPIQVAITDSLVNGRTSYELEQAVREGLVIRDYLNAEIGLKEVAELLNMSYDEAGNWLHQKSIPTLKRFNDLKPEKIEKTETAESKNFEDYKSIHLDELPERCRHKYKAFLWTHNPDKFVPVAYRAKSKTNRLLWHVCFVPRKELPDAFKSLKSCRLIYNGLLP